MNNENNALYFSLIQTLSQSLIRLKTAGAAAVSACEDACTERGSSEAHTLAFAPTLGASRCLPDCLTHARDRGVPVRGWTGAVGGGPVVPVSGGYADPTLPHWPLVFNPCRER